MVLALAALVSTGAMAASEAYQQCDALAAYPWEPAHNGKGVEWGEVIAPPAEEACRAALAETPDAPEVKYRLGRTLLQEFQYDEGFALLLASARAGYAPAETAYGTAYMQGDGVDNDYDVAFAWLSKAAVHGNPVGTNNLGNLYEHGLGVSKDLLKARELYAAGAAKGYPLAMFNLAQSYVSGPEPDYAKAFEWNTKAADAGWVQAWRGVARAYEAGQGVPISSSRGYAAWLQGAEAGDYVAQMQVGLRYMRGRDVPQDYTVAEAWLRKAAEQYYPRAQFYLGQLLFSHGDGRADYDEGVRWMEEAGARGEFDAYLALAQRYMGFGELNPARQYAEAVARIGNQQQQVHARQLLDTLVLLEQKKIHPVTEVPAPATSQG